jgi:VIT1/CCC1 family predicted Fe2+/Mn2+ transporter
MTSTRVLDPIDRVTEVLFGLIMVLTFTGSLSVAEAGRDDTRTMLIGALGCNFAWGIIDAVLFLMGGLANKGRTVLALIAARRSASGENAQQIIAEILPAPVARLIQPAEFALFEQRLRQQPEPAIPGLDGDDWRGALGVFLLVFLSTFPVVIPFIVIGSAALALRVSNAIAIVMLLVTGYSYGRLTGRSAWGWGVGMVLVGLTLAGLTMALGG